MPPVASLTVPSLKEMLMEMFTINPMQNKVATRGYLKKKVSCKTLYHPGERV